MKPYHYLLVGLLLVVVGLANHVLILGIVALPCFIAAIRHSTTESPKNNKQKKVVTIMSVMAIAALVAALAGVVIFVLTFHL